MKITDLTFTEIDVPQPLTRVVSLVPSVTETLFALGRGSTLVGRTRYCVLPDPEVRAIEKIGGTKDIDVEKIIQLKPQLVLANKEENRRADIDALRAAGINVHVAQPTTVEEGLAYVSTCGRLFDAEDIADAIVRAGAREIVAAAERTRELEEHNNLRVTPRDHIRPRVVAFIWHDPWMVAGLDTYIGDMIRTLGGDHVLEQSTERYFAMDPVDIAALRPDILLFPDEPYHFKQSDLQFWRDNFEDTPAVKDNRLRLCDGQDLCWFGSRIPEALKRLAPVLAW
ncbi:MAG: ABC transporter substrate-binding protein [Planctomycetes bacterium]|nr:ABC transporter substrate-binding protein [Planctomycetota bacterium]